MTICDMSVTELSKKLATGELTSVSIVRAYREAYEADKSSEKPLHGYIEFFETAEQDAARADEARAAGDTRPLLGVPFASKDNISIKGKACTCGSAILEGYVAPYNATVTEQLMAAGAIPLGRTNMDEFAMGSSTEYSSYGPSRNPVNRDLTPGGSSGGSAAVVAGGLAPIALGTETGGSIRLPASYCGIYGLKPTYGSLSRSGVVAFGSSFDQVGLLARSVDDIGLMLSVMGGLDRLDDTSTNTDFSALANLKSADISRLKIAIPKEFMEAKGLDPEVAAVFEQTCEWFRSRGATIETISIPVLEAAIGCYYVIALAEGASNLGRFDGIRYGNRRDPGTGYDDLYVKTRSEGCNAEVKRRIIIGNYILSNHFSGDTYKKAVSVRARIQREVAAVFESFDILLCPTSPTTAFPLGEKIDDPPAMYLSDLYTTFANLARIPSLSIPAGKSTQGLPVGVQLCGPQGCEEKILEVARAWEEDK